jgi:hypothetical protein
MFSDATTAEATPVDLDSIQYFLRILIKYILWVNETLEVSDK